MTKAGVMKPGEHFAVIKLSSKAPDAYPIFMHYSDEHLRWHRKTFHKNFPSSLPPPFAPPPGNVFSVLRHFYGGEIKASTRKFINYAEIYDASHYAKRENEAFALVLPIDSRKCLKLRSICCYHKRTCSITKFPTQSAFRRYFHCWPEVFFLGFCAGSASMKNKTQKQVLLSCLVSFVFLY